MLNLFSQITFWVNFFKSAWNSAFLKTFFRFFCRVYYHFFKLWSQTRKKQHLKNQKMYLKKCILDLNCAHIKGIGFFIFQKKSNSLQPSVQVAMSAPAGRGEGGVGNGILPLVENRGWGQGGHKNFAKRNSAVFRVIFILYFRENFGKISAEFRGISFRERGWGR
jgi:hypothetical protein